MSDNKKWFKLWASILIDQDHSNLTLQDVGRWTRLMAHVVSSGERGKLRVIAPAKQFLLSLEFDTLEQAKEALKRLPNVVVLDAESPPQINRNNHKWVRDIGQNRCVTNVPLNDNGSFTVIIKNWFKYQVDSTAYARVKRSRHKKRGEERRSITSPSPLSSAALPPPLGAASAPLETAPERKGRAPRSGRASDRPFESPYRAPNIYENYVPHDPAKFLKDRSCQCNGCLRGVGIERRSKPRSSA